jgi:hypothetical protein
LRLPFFRYLLIFPLSTPSPLKAETLAVSELPHEVCDHPDADLSARLVHLWNHSVEVGVCETIVVRGSPVSVPLGGSVSVRSYWSTLGGDTRSFSQVL